MERKGVGPANFSDDSAAYSALEGVFTMRRYTNTRLPLPSPLL